MCNAHSTHKMPKAPWTRLISSTSGEPKWIFVRYLAILSRLYTNDRLEKWNLVDDSTRP